MTAGLSEPTDKSIGSLLVNVNAVLFQKLNVSSPGLDMTIFSSLIKQTLFLKKIIFLILCPTKLGSGLVSSSPTVASFQTQ